MRRTASDAWPGADHAGARHEQDSHARGPNTCRRRYRPTPRVTTGDGEPGPVNRVPAAADARWFAAIGRRWPGPRWHRVRTRHGTRRRVRLRRSASAAGRRSTAPAPEGSQGGECGRRSVQPISLAVARRRHGWVTRRLQGQNRSRAQLVPRKALQPRHVATTSAVRCGRHTRRRGPVPTRYV